MRCSVSVRIRIAVGERQLLAEWKDVGVESHTIETSLLAPLQRVVQHGLVRDWKQSFGQILDPCEGVERSAGAA